MRPTSWQRRLCLAVVAACTLLPAASLAAPVAKQDLIYNLPAEPMSLDPTYASDVPSMALALNMFEGLVRLDQSNRPVPAMAESWTISTDGLVYRFKLRDARWSNGQPVTAADFVFSWLRALKPGQAAERIGLLFAVANAEAYHKGALLDPRQVGIKAIDARTFEVRLVRPAGHFLALCSLPPFLPVNKAVVEANPEGWSLNPKTAVANGPFRLALYRPRAQVILGPNAYYWQKSLCRLQSITFTWLASPQALAAYGAGLLHGLIDPSPGLAGQYVTRPEPRLTYLQFNLRKPPFDQVMLRHVVSTALNRNALVSALGGDEIPAFAAVPPGLPDAATGKDFRAVGGGMLVPDFDQNLARRLLGVAGFPNGTGLPRIELVYVSGQRNETLARAAAASLGEIGFQVMLVAVAWHEYERRLSTGEFALARVGWTADYPDPYSFLSVFASGAGTDFGGYQSEAFDRALQEAAATADTARRMAALHHAEEILLGDLPIVPVSFGKRVFLAQPYVHDVAYVAYGVPIFHRAWLDAH